HERSLDRAREGFYPGDVAADVSAERLARFFHKDDGGYRVKKEVRERVVFAPHNLLGDPPFSRMDLISCRNVLIYLQPDAQRDVLDVFHYALVPDGYLVLGTSETIEGSAEFFLLLDKAHRVWRKRSVQNREARLPTFPTLDARAPLAGSGKQRPSQGEPTSYGALHQQLVERYAPPSMLVTPDDKVAHLSEHVGRYLVHPGGELTANAFKLVRDELRIELRAALHAAREKGQVTRSKPIPVRFNGEVAPVVLHVRPQSGNEHQRFVLVIFDELEPVESVSGEAPSDGSPDLRIGELQTELDLARQRMQSIIEASESTQEEMRASQEELQSSNEELRSTLEELETSKEELQSVNEELQTVNQENRHKVEELSQLSSDLQNLLSSTDIATLFLDRTLRILRFTPRVGEIFNVRPVDRGRPLSDLTHRLGYDELQSDAETVLRTLVPVEREVRDERGGWFMTRVLPYRTTDDRIGGIVLTFVDITARKRAQQEVEDAKVYAESIVETLHEPLLVLHPDLRVRSANQAFYDQFLVSKADTLGRLVYELGNGQWDIPALRTLLEEVLPDNNVFRDFEVRHDFNDIGERIMLVNARRLDHVQLILLGLRDITERKRAEEALRASEARHAFLVRLEDVLRPLGEAAAIQDAAARVVGEHLAVSRAMYVEVDGEPGAEIGTVRGVYVADAAMPRFPERHTYAVFGARVMPVRRRADTIVVTDVATDPEFDTAERDAWAASGVRAAITVPLVKDGRFIAEFGVQSAAPRRWTATDIALVQETAERTWAAAARARAEAAMRQAHARLEERVEERTAELAATNASLEIQIRERRAAEAHIKALFSRLVTAQEEERRRIARDIHDQLGQQITALRMNISALHARPEGAVTTEEQITRTEALAEELDRAIDFLTWELRPAALDHLGLSAALAHLVSGWSERFGIEAEFATSGLDHTRFTPDVETNLHRLTQEALHNIYKHAKASHVSVLLEQRDARLVLVVEDDGVGFSVGSNKGVDVGSFGLVNMRERATLAGGELTIDSTPGHGTTLIVRVPLGSDNGRRDDKTQDSAR
ncbi:MAG TPA: CheR family methyltransferase, partial [Gemmatimonadaceae bacterium]